MSKAKVVAIAAAALVAGLVLGTMTIASAATTTTTPAPGTIAGACAGAGLRLGATMRQSGATLADVVAKLTDLKVEDVRASRQDGTSFKDIAASKGVSSDKVVSSALDARKAALDAAVKDGRISQTQADAALKTMETRLNANVGSTAPGCNGAGAGGACGAGGAGGGRRGMMGGGACGAGGGACGGAGAQAPAVQ